METIDEGEEMIPIEPKSKMTNLPMIGLFIRFADTLLHLNNLKFRVMTHEKHMLGLEDKQRFDHDYVVALEEQHKTLEEQHKTLEEQHKTLEEQHKTLEEQHKTLEEQHKTLEEQHRSLSASLEPMVEKLVAQQIYYQSLALQQRIDQLGFDAHILGTLPTKT